VDDAVAHSDDVEVSRTTNGHETSRLVRVQAVMLARPMDAATSVVAPGPVVPITLAFQTLVRA
jgi:hypothetical protein